MKQNKYDDQRFFLKYSQMERSRRGLEGAGEWPSLQAILPDMDNRVVLDLGCGYGWHCKYAVDNGANRVVGIDISRRMLEIAAEKNGDERIEYRCAAMEDVAFPANAFDAVISSLAFHYVRDFAPLVRNIAKWLKAGGAFVFSVEHPVFTAYGTQDWHYDSQGNILHFPVDRYYYEGSREAIFLGEKVVKYHRTLTTYLHTLLQNGFVLQHVIEPQPPAEMLHMAGMQDEMRRPMMLLIGAEKK